MIRSYLNRPKSSSKFGPWARNLALGNLIKSRNLFEVQTIECGPNVACLDIDPTGNFLLVGLMSGSVELQGVVDPNLGLLEPESRLDVSRSVLSRVQWNPGEEQFFSTLDTQLHLVDPVEMRPIEKFNFDMQPSWSAWNPNDRSVIAVSGSLSQTRLVDIRSGSSVQTIILGNPTRITPHRVNSCLWSPLDTYCLILGDNDGCIHIYDTRQVRRPLALAHKEIGQISHMSFTTDNTSIITSSGPKNRLTQWFFDKCTLQPKCDKFRKPPKQEIDEPGYSETNQSQQVDPVGSSSTQAKKLKKSKIKEDKEKRRKQRAKLTGRDLYLQCQFYLTESHIFCPVSMDRSKLKQFHVYDIATGLRIKTIRSDDIASRGVFAITGLLSDSLAIYSGGRGGLRVWTLDEDHQRKIDEKAREYHVTRWDSDED